MCYGQAWFKVRDYFCALPLALRLNVPRYSPLILVGTLTRKFLAADAQPHGVFLGAHFAPAHDSSARQPSYAGRKARSARETREARSSLRPADRVVWRR